MKTIKEVKKEHPEYRNLINAVFRRLSLEDVENVNYVGMSAGFGNFVYYADTCEFAWKHNRDIVGLLTDDAESFDQEIVEMVGGFGLFKNNPMDAEDKMDLYCFLANKKNEGHIIPNLMCWYAVETICGWFED